MIQNQIRTNQKFNLKLANISSQASLKTEKLNHQVTNQAQNRKVASQIQNAGRRKQLELFLKKKKRMRWNQKVQLKRTKKLKKKLRKKQNLKKRIRRKRSQRKSQRFLRLNKKRKQMRKKIRSPKIRKLRRTKLRRKTNLKSLNQLLLIKNLMMPHPLQNLIAKLQLPRRLNLIPKKLHRNPTPLQQHPKLTTRKNLRPPLRLRRSLPNKNTVS